MKKTIVLFTIVILFSFALPTYAQPVRGTATVLRNANLRGGPGTAYAVVGGASQGDSVTVVGCNAACDWYQLADGAWIAAFLVDVTTSATIPPITVPATQNPITVVSWNTDLNDASISVISERIAAFENVDLWGLVAVNRTRDQFILERAAEMGTAAHFGSVITLAGGDERLVALYSTARFDMIESWEEELLDRAGSTRTALVLHLRDKVSSVHFLFMVNHLSRDSDADRQQQAELLNAWAARQVLPVIAVGDYNFDWDTTENTHDTGYDLLTTADRFKWVQPETLLTTQCTGWPCESRWVLDFVFTVGAAQTWPAESEIVVVPNDFPDDSTTSDHRPVLARIWPEAAPPLALRRPTETPTPTSPFVTGSGNVRGGPGPNYPIVDQVRPGQLLRITGRTLRGDWYQINNRAWIAAYLVNGVTPRPNIVTVPATPTPYPPVPTVTPTPTLTPEETTQPRP